MSGVWELEEHWVKQEFVCNVLAVVSSSFFFYSEEINSLDLEDKAIIINWTIPQRTLWGKNLHHLCRTS